jgi:hypothetical protein
MIYASEGSLTRTGASAGENWLLLDFWTQTACDASEMQSLVYIDSLKSLCCPVSHFLWRNRFVFLVPFYTIFQKIWVVHTYHLSYLRGRDRKIVV